MMVLLEITPLPLPELLPYLLITGGSTLAAIALDYFLSLLNGLIYLGIISAIVTLHIRENSARAVTSH